MRPWESTRSTTWRDVLLVLLSYIKYSRMVQQLVSFHILAVVCWGISISWPFSWWIVRDLWCVLDKVKDRESSCIFIDGQLGPWNAPAKLVDCLVFSRVFSPTTGVVEVLCKNRTSGRRWYGENHVLFPLFLSPPVRVRLICDDVERSFVGWSRWIWALKVAR